MKENFAAVTNAVNESYAHAMEQYNYEVCDLGPEIDAIRLKILDHYYNFLAGIFEVPKHWFYDEDFTELNESIWEMSIYKDMYAYVETRAYYETKIAGLCDGVEDLSNYDEVDAREVHAMGLIKEEG